MKRLILMLPLFLMMACKTDVSTDNTELAKPESLIEETQYEYTEYYPGKKQVKLHGYKDEEGKREGKWDFFNPNGIKLSLQVYSHGLKDGFSVVFYPSGAQRYIGEYSQDQKIGEWRFFDESGKLIETKTF